MDGAAIQKLLRQSNRDLNYQLSQLVEATMHHHIIDTPERFKPKKKWSLFKMTCDCKETITKLETEVKRLTTIQRDQEQEKRKKEEAAMPIYKISSKYDLKFNKERFSLEKKIASSSWNGRDYVTCVTYSEIFASHDRSECEVRQKALEETKLQVVNG